MVPHSCYTIPMPLIVENKRGLFHMQVLESWEAGIVLTGPEVKSAKRGSIDLTGSYVSMSGGSLWLNHCTIAPYPYARGVQRQYDPRRPRRLLVTKRERNTIIGKVASPGLTLIPTRVYTKQSFVKLTIALVRGKRAYDKREQIRRRETERTIQRALRSRLRNE